ncbi:GntR family transcriptional regulator [Tropicimonas sp. IMCC6043]|uniref:GntR family transcriptional regulator n=1 Tax=Tropicimonas sp. IMCC6043 TaxID=2510645 RepID=UPI00101CF4FB|nr:GntR family transcriptional regulator [Tropicimonas sp. IMCC6043]RYH07850.1 GntR family transcriptional regulator [Tropicimonas sp. IMCC6043]
MARGGEVGANGPKISAVQKVVAALTDSIATGVLDPGERVDEVRLAEQLGVSRTPVREALNQLVAQRILVAGEKRGVRVAQYSREELSQIFEVMYEIEVMCARMASQRLTLLSRSEIELAQAECVRAAESGDRIAYMHANEDLHHAIYRATGNEYMWELASEFRRRTGPFRAKKFATTEDLIASAKSHESLLRSIFSADSKVASDGMREHMAASFMQTLEAFKHK